MVWEDGGANNPASYPMTAGAQAQREHLRVGAAGDDEPHRRRHEVSDVTTRERHLPPKRNPEPASTGELGQLEMTSRAAGTTKSAMFSGFTKSTVLHQCSRTALSATTTPRS